MSWEHVKGEKPCFCGRGRIVTDDASDDWGRTEYDERMECESCAKEYVGEPVPARWPDKGAVGWRWTKRDKRERQRSKDEARRRAAEEAIAKGTAKARARLAQPLIDATAAIRSRRALWAFLQAHGIRRSRSYNLSSFNRFNAAIRESGREAVLREIIDDENVDVIAQALGRM